MLDQTENFKYPKAFFYSPKSNTHSIGGVALPVLYKEGLDSHYINRKIGKSSQAYLEDMYTNVLIAYDLFPSSVFIFNVNDSKIDDANWIRFLQKIKDMPAATVRVFGRGLMHRSRFT